MRRAVLAGFLLACLVACQLGDDSEATIVGGGLGGSGGGGDAGEDGDG